MMDCLCVKEVVIGWVREEIEKYIKLWWEVMYRNEVLREWLEKWEKIVIGLKIKLIMLSSWVV